MTTETKLFYSLRVASARDVVWTKTQPPSLYVNIRLDESETYRTNVFERSMAPYWNEEFMIYGELSSIISLSIDLFGGDACLGLVQIPLGTLLAKCARDNFVTLKTRSDTATRDATNTGNITVKLSKLDLSDPTLWQAVDYLLSRGKCQIASFDDGDEMTDLEGSVKSLHQALALASDTNPRRTDILQYLGAALCRRFMRLGRLVDINNSIANLDMAVRLADDDYPDMPMLLCNLGTSQSQRFDHIGEIADLEGCIFNFELATQLTDDNHPLKPRFLFNLGIAYSNRFERLDEMTNLDDSISNMQRAVELVHDSHPEKPGYLSNLGIQLGVRFLRLDNLADIHESILHLQNAARLTEDGDPEQAGYLSNLSDNERVRYERLDDLADLRNSLSNAESAVRLTDDMDPDKPGYYCNLSNAQSCRYKRFGELRDLEDCVSNSQKAVSLTGDDNPLKPLYLSNLGTELSSRFEVIGELADIDNSIANLQRAVQLCRDGHPNKPSYLSNLGGSQLSRFRRFSDEIDIENGLANLTRALELTDDGHPKKPFYFFTLGTSQENYFRDLPSRRTMSIILASVANLTEAVRLTDDRHPNKAAYLSSLALSQERLFEYTGDLSHIDASISNHKKAIGLTDDTRDTQRPLYAIYYRNLGRSHAVRFECLRDQADLAAAIVALKFAALSRGARPRDALLSARQWASISYRNGDLMSAFHGYRAALDILPKLAWLGLTSSSHHEWIVNQKCEKLGCEAASCAIQLGRLEEAVELLDLGRSIFWQQSSSLRSNLDTLRAEEPELAAEFGRVARELDAGNFSNPLVSVQMQTGAKWSGLEEIGRQRRNLVGTWEGLLDQIRQRPKFEHFLRPLPFCNFRHAASNGQVIIINVSQHGSDALIFDSTHPVLHVPLLNIDLETLTELSADILLERPVNPTANSQRRYIGAHLKPALRRVWDDIVVPIFTQIHIPLESTQAFPERRIWWYPTGPLTSVPIHAAGPGKIVDVSRLVVSSYITTLSMLLQAQKNNMSRSSGQVRLLAISQPDTPGQGRLPCSTEEATEVIQVFASAGCSKDDIIHLDGSDAVIDRVSSAMDSCSWMHFACHGMQHPTSRMQSALALHNGNLELGQIASKRLSIGQFAFLSVCHAASGLRDLPGEAMHLAAGLQFSGFPGVIATMWSICDFDAPRVAQHTYRYLLRNGLEGLDVSEAATALSHAVLCLRDDPHVTVDRWAPFIHFGV